MKTSAFLLGSLLTFSLCTAATPPSEPLTRTIFDSHNSPVPYRIPAIVQTREGRILAVADYRISKTDIGYNNRNGLYQIDEVMRYSDDRGETWSETRTIVKGDEHATDTVRTAFGDPSLVADRLSDEVLMHSVAGKTGYHAATRKDPQHAYFFRSHDGGRTWDQGIDLTEMIYSLYDGKLSDGAPADGIFLTSGKIMQSRYVKVGKYHRLYIAHPLRRKGYGRTGTYVIYSDDFGRTWHSLGNVTDGAPSVAQDESKVEELPDGSVLLSCRDAGGGRRFNVFYYDDPVKATGHWGKEVMPENMTGKEVNACNGGVLVVPVTRKSDGKALHLILQSVPLNPKRVDVGFFYKEIEGTGDYFDADALGRGWVKALQVTDKDSCYSTMLLMDDGQVGFLYEESLKDDGYDIIFKSLSIEEITLGRYALRPGFLR
ncbi:MAG: sialidase family protein [Porphyromonas sp.]|nr:sialidase family protein [Bacteroidales bacterium]MDY3101087.1 sialidase family protein [Porphyromonas sp.]